MRKAIKKRRMFCDTKTSSTVLRIRRGSFSLSELALSSAESGDPPDEEVDMFKMYMRLVRDHHLRNQSRYEAEVQLTELQRFGVIQG